MPVLLTYSCSCRDLEPYSVNFLAASILKYIVGPSLVYFLTRGYAHTHRINYLFLSYIKLEMGQRGSSTLENIRNNGLCGTIVAATQGPDVCDTLQIRSI